MSVARKLIVEMDDDVERTIDALVNDLRSRKVPAVITGDESGTSIRFDARKGLSKLPAGWRRALEACEFKNCEAADRVADWGGKVVNKLQSEESYEVYINAEAATDFLRTCPPPPESVRGEWPGKAESFDPAHE